MNAGLLGNEGDISVFITFQRNWFFRLARMNARQFLRMCVREKWESNV